MTVRSLFCVYATIGGMRVTIYLDTAATAKPLPEVIDAMMPYLAGEKWYNPSSLYSPAAQVKKDVENARKIAADFINASSEEIFFTSGGSESNCMAIKGFADRCRLEGFMPIVMTTELEHKSVNELLLHNPSFTLNLYVFNDRDGIVDIELMSRQLNRLSLTEGIEKTRLLVSIQFANNEIGTIQDIKKIAELVHDHGGLLHVDAVQAFGQIPIDVKELGIDMMSVSGHKIGTPKGIGFLYKKKNVDICPLIYGNQMNNMRGGTENVPYIIGMAKAIELSKNNIKYHSRLELIRDYFIDKLEEIGCKLNGPRTNRLPNNISVILPESINGESMLYMLDMCGIYVATGSACNSQSIEPSHVLKSISLSDEEAARTIRVTIPHDISKEKINKVVCEIEKQIKLLSLH